MDAAPCIKREYIHRLCEILLTRLLIRTRIPRLSCRGTSWERVLLQTTASNAEEARPEFPQSNASCGYGLVLTVEEHHPSQTTTDVFSAIEELSETHW